MFNTESLGGNVHINCAIFFEPLIDLGIIYLLWVVPLAFGYALFLHLLYSTHLSILAKNELLGAGLCLTYLYLS